MADPLNPLLDHQAASERNNNRLDMMIRRPLLLLMLTVAAGRLLGAQRIGVWLVIPLTALLAVALSFSPIRPEVLRWLLPLFFFLALSTQLGRHLPARTAADHLQGRCLRLSGRVLEMTDTSGAYTQTIFALDQGGRLWLSGPSHDLAGGARIEAVIELEKPEGRRNPGGFDQAAWLRGKGVYLTGEVVTETPVRRLSPPGGLPLKRLAWQQKQQLIHVLASWLPERPAALVSAVLLGDRSRLNAMDQAILRKAGLTHLTAVSGTHVALLIWPAEAVLRLISRRRLVRRLLLAAALLGFGFLTGWPVSVSRAIFMQGLIMTAGWSGRRADRLNSLGGAALLILLIEPDAALQTGFWLSVSATFVLIVLVPHLAGRLKERWPGLPLRLARWLILPAAIQLSLLPLTIGLSGEVVWAGWLSSWLVMPLIQLLLPYSLFWLLPAGGLMRVSGPWTDTLIRWSAEPIRLGADCLFAIAEFCARLPLPRILLGDFSLPLWGLLLLLLLQASGLWTQAADFIGCSRSGSMRCRQWLCLILCASSLLIVWFRPLVQPDTDVWFLDVGQGDATLLRSRHQAILVDGGPPGSGCRVLLPALDALGVSRLDAAVVTHGHDDHCGGIAELLRLRRIRCLLVPEWFLSPATADRGGWQAADLPEAEEQTQIQSLLDQARQSSIPVQALRISDTIFSDHRLRLKVLPLPPSALHDDDGNARSLLLDVDCAGCRLLLTGDCSGSVETTLLEQQQWPAADLLKIAHHGSASSTSSAFLRQVQPDAAVISVGAYNPYGHPSPRLIDRLTEQGMTIWRTDRHGAVRWQVRGEQWSMTGMKDLDRLTG